MKASRETDLVRACLELLQLRGVYAWRNNSGGAVMGKRFVRFGKKGSADILGVLGGGRILAVECKMPGRKPSPDQRAFLDAIAAAGGLALVVRNVGQLDDALRAEGVQ